jgi:parallel beta-helix repeat protein
MRRPFIFILVALLLLAAVVPFVTNVSAGPDPYDEDKNNGGNGQTYQNLTWYVDANDELLYANQTIYLNGDLQINTSGELTLQNVTLNITGDITIYGNLTVNGSVISINCSSEPQFGIWVNSRGRFDVDNTTITATDPTNHYFFNVSGHMAMRWCEVEYIYSTWGAVYIYDGGIWCMSDDILIFESDIHDSNEVGICIHDCDPQIIGNDIHNNGDEAIYGYGSAALIKGNTMSNNSVYDAMWLEDCGGMRIENNIMHNLSWSGVYAEYCQYLYIANNTIYDVDEEGLYLDDCGGDVINNTIYDTSTYGINVMDWYGTYTNLKLNITHNKINHTPYDGIYVEVWDCNISNNVIWNCTANGISIDTGWATTTYYYKVHENEIWNCTDSGIYFESLGEPDIANCTIYNNTDGIEADGETGTIYNNTIFNNSDSGITCVFGADPDILDNNIYSNGNVGIESLSSNPDIYDNHVHNNTNAGIYHSSPTSSCIVNDNLVEYNNMTGLYALSSNALTVQGNLFKGHTMAGAVENSSSDYFADNVYFDNGNGTVCLAVSTTTFFNETILRSVFNGTMCNNSSPMIFNTTIEDSGENAIWTENGGGPWAINCTIVNSGVSDWNLTSDSHGVTLNSTYDDSMVYFGDTRSNLTTKWYLHVRVWDNQSNPVNGASIWARNKNNVLEYATTAGSVNYAMWLPVSESVNQSSGVTYLTPTNVSANCAGYTMGYATPEPFMDKSKWVDVTIYVNLAPNQVSDLTPTETHDLTPRLNWTHATDPNGDSLKYYVKVGSTLGGTDVVNNLTTRNNHYNITNPLSYGNGNKTYYVVIYANDGNLGISAASHLFYEVNNRPTTPVTSITVDPKVNEDIVCTITTVSTDIDVNPTDTITYEYDWYKDSVFQGVYSQNNVSSLTSTVPSSATSTGETWRCEVTAWDGFVSSIASIDTSTIFNNAPVLNNTLVDFSFDEDTTDESIDLTKVFEDPDGDFLTYSFSGNTNIGVTILAGYTVRLTPDPNWNGQETITFTATDSLR